MNARLIPCGHWRRSETVNGWQEAVADWAEIGTVRAAVSAGTGGALQRVNEIARVESTHTAATWDTVEVGDRLRPREGDVPGTGYEVLYVIPGGRRRMHQLFLRRTDFPPDREETHGD